MNLIADCFISGYQDYFLDGQLVGKIRYRNNGGYEIKYIPGAVSYPITLLPGENEE